jgi:hypothetical protein
MAVAVGPGVELLHDPGALAGGRVHQAVAQRLGAGRLLGGVASAPAAVLLERGHGGGHRLGLVLFGGRRARHRHVHVHAHHVVGVDHPEQGGDRRAPVTALGAVAVVAQAPHELGPRLGDAAHAPARLGGLLAEAVARQRRAHHVEGVGRVAPVGGRIHQRAERVEELDDRPRPAVGEDQRQRLGVRRADVEAVDAQAVDLRAKGTEVVQPRLDHPPVVAVRPVRAQVLHVGPRDALRPVLHRLRLRPAGATEPLAQVVEVGLGDGDGRVFHGPYV